MKKKRFYSALALLIIASFLIVTMNNCKKTNQDAIGLENQPDQTALIEKSKAMQEHILAFKAKMEYYRDNPGLKGGEQRLQIDSTILDWEATINLTYCHSYLDLFDIINFDTVLDIPLVEGDSITVTKASEKYYDNILESIRSKYLTSDFQEKRLVSVDFEPRNNGDSLYIEIMVGNALGNVDPLLNWYYGELEGECLTNQYFGDTDAATVLADEVRDHFYQAPPENCRWYFTNIISYYDKDPTSLPNPDDVVTDNYQDYLIYYAHENVSPGLTEDVRCVESLTEKGFYKQSYINITRDYIDNAPVYPEGKMKFQTCDYVGKELSDSNNETYLQHELTTRLGRRFVACSFPIVNIENY